MSDDEAFTPKLMNVKDIGICLIGRSGAILPKANFGGEVIGEAFHSDSSGLEVKGTVWNIRVYPSKSNYTVFINKDAYNDPRRFESQIDSQIGRQDRVHIQDVKRTLFCDFIYRQIPTHGKLVEYHFITHVGRNAPPDDPDTHEYEIWAFNPNLILDHTGKKIKPNWIWLNKAIHKKAPILPHISFIPGPISIMEAVFDASTPFNFNAFIMSVGSSLEMLHSYPVRESNGGQYPLTILMSIGKGKGQGKSGGAGVMMWIGSDAPTHKWDPAINKNAPKKASNNTSLIMLLEDVSTKDCEMLKSLAMWRYDADLVYRTNEGEFVPKGEILGTANELRKFSEREADRIKIIPFRSWTGDLLPEERERKSKVLWDLLKSKTKPTTFTIGMVGEHVRSDSFKQDKADIGNELHKHISIIKSRTVHTNYSGTLAMVKYLFEVFGYYLEPQGHTYEKFLKWVYSDLADMMKYVHIEEDNAQTYIVRYVLGLADYLESFDSTTAVLKLCRIAETKKLSDKYCLSFHPSNSENFDVLNYARLPQFRVHVLGMGGRIDVKLPNLYNEIARGTFLKTHIPEGDEIDYDVTSENWTLKTAILVPISLLPSTLILRLCSLTGQNLQELADKETPSNYDMSSCESVKNSTLIEGHGRRATMSFNLALSESLEIPRGELLNGIIDDTTLSSLIHDMGSESTGDVGNVTLFENMVCPADDEAITLENQSCPAGYQKESMLKSNVILTNLSCPAGNQNDSTLKSNRDNEATLSSTLRSEMVQCPVCKKISTTSGLQRHICKGKMRFSCDKCELGFQTAAGLKRHAISMHTVYLGRVHKCDCSKVYTTKKGLSDHKKKCNPDETMNVTKESTVNSTSKDFSCVSFAGEGNTSQINRFLCNLCNKNYKSKQGLQRHNCKAKDPVDTNSSSGCISDVSVPTAVSLTSAVDNLSLDLLTTDSSSSSCYRAESQVLNGFLCNGCNKNYKTDRGLQKHKCKNAINSTNINVDDVPDDVPTTVSVPTTGSLTTGSLSVESSSQTSDRPRRLTRSQRN